MWSNRVLESIGGAAYLWIKQTLGATIKRIRGLTVPLRTSAPIWGINPFYVEDPRIASKKDGT
jgi:hypothetical protein